MEYHIDFNFDLKRNPYKGLYIAIEGIDGSGKSTQIRNVSKHLNKLGHTVVITGEPRPGQMVEKLIRKVLFAKVKIPSTGFQDLYTADRVFNHKNIIEPALEKGHTVISHRNFWSAVTYGIIDRGEKEYSLEKAYILMVANGIVSHYHQFIAPDYTFYLDISVDTATARLSKMSKKGDIYEKRSKLARIAEGYRWVAQNFSNEITIINGEQPVEAITNNIIDKIKYQKAKSKNTE